MMDEKSLNEKLDELIEAAIPTIKANMVDDSEDAPEVQTSKEHDEKMQEIFELARRMEKDPEGTAQEYNALVKSYEEKARKGAQNISALHDAEEHEDVVYVSKRNNVKKFWVALVAAVLMIGCIGAVGASKLDIIKALFEDKEEKAMWRCLSVFRNWRRTLLQKRRILLYRTV